jgi:AcrR family transcriptional regulator
MDELTHQKPIRSPDQRADARQNRDRILGAADIVFEQQGVNAPLEAIITEARVGKSTFFRHFATRQDLLATLLDRGHDELQEQADAVQGRPDGLFHMISFMAQRIGSRAALVEYWNAAERNHPVLQSAFKRSEAIWTEAILRAKDAHLCRHDLTVRDIAMIGRMIGAALHDCRAEEKASTAERAAVLLAEGYCTPS